MLGNDSLKLLQLHTIDATNSGDVVLRAYRNLHQTTGGASAFHTSSNALLQGFAIIA